MGYEFYILGIIIPVVIVLVSIVGGLKIGKATIVPAIVFVASIVWTLFEINVRNVGWGSLLGWSIFYTVLSLSVTLLVKAIKNKA